MKTLHVLDEQHFHINELIVAASERSVDKEIVSRGKIHIIGTNLPKRHSF